MTEAQIVKIVNKVMDFWATLIEIPSFTSDDVRQQGWVYAIEGLEEFEAAPTERNLLNFMTVHVRNRLLYLKKVKEGSYKMPCIGCPFSEGDLCKLGPKANCEVWSNWERKFERRQSYAMIVNPEDYEHNHTYEVDFEGNFDNKEVVRKIFDRLSPDMRAELLRLMDGVYLTTPRRARLKNKVREILGELDE